MPHVEEVRVFSDKLCTKQIISTYVGESGHKPASGSTGDGSVAFDKNSGTYWTPQCEPCNKHEAWLTFSTTENAGCVKAFNLGYKDYWECPEGTCWDDGLIVDLKMPDGSWSSVMTSRSGREANMAKAGMEIDICYISISL